MNLYLIKKVIQDVMDEHTNYETGEITQEGWEQLEKLNLAKEDLIDEMIKAYKNQVMLIDGMKAEIDRLKSRIDKAKITQDSIIRQLTPHLTEGEKIVTPEYELKWTTSTSVAGLEQYDPELEYNAKKSPLQKFVVKKVPDPVYSFNKAEIQKALKIESNDLPLDVYINKVKNPKIK